jgi:hypothetical protein
VEPALFLLPHGSISVWISFSDNKCFRKRLVFDFVKLCIFCVSSFVGWPKRSPLTTPRQTIAPADGRTSETANNSHPSAATPAKLPATRTRAQQRSATLHPAPSRSSLTRWIKPNHAACQACHAREQEVSSNARHARPESKRSAAPQAPRHSEHSVYQLSSVRLARQGQFHLAPSIRCHEWLRVSAGTSLRRRPAAR